MVLQQCCSHCLSGLLMPCSPFYTSFCQFLFCRVLPAAIAVAKAECETEFIYTDINLEFLCLNESPGIVSRQMKSGSAALN